MASVSARETTNSKVRSSESFEDPHNIQAYCQVKGFEAGAPSNVQTHTVTHNGFPTLVRNTYRDFVGNDLDLAEEVPYSLYLYYHIFILWIRLLSIFRCNGQISASLEQDLVKMKSLGEVVLHPVIRAYLLGLGNLSTRGGWNSRLVPSFSLERLVRGNNHAGANVGQPITGEDCMVYLQTPLPYVASRGLQTCVHRTITQVEVAEWTTPLDPNGPEGATGCTLTEDVLGYAAFTPMAWGMAQQLATLGWGENGYPTDIQGSTLGFSPSTMRLVAQLLASKAGTFNVHPVDILDSASGSPAQMVFNYYEPTPATAPLSLSEAQPFVATCDDQLAGKLWKGGCFCQYQVSIRKTDLENGAFYGCGWFFRKPEGLVSAVGLTPTVYASRLDEPGIQSIIGSQFRLASTHRGRALARALTRSTIVAAPIV